MKSKYMSLTWKIILWTGFLITAYWLVLNLTHYYIEQTTVHVRAEQCTNGTWATNCAIFGYGVREAGYVGVEARASETPTLSEADEMASLIRSIADEMNFTNSQLLVDLAYCESRLNPYALNATGNHPPNSVDRGLFQINSYWQSGVSNECSFNPTCATKWTINKIQAGGLHLWVCAKYI